MDRKETEAALAMERALLDEIFRHTPASMAIWRGPDLKLEHVNPGYLALFPGRPLLGMRPHEAFPETRDQPLGGYLNGVYETGQPHVGRETLVRHRRREGGPIQECYYDFAYLRINGSDKRPYGVYDFAIDVTERVLARQELERKQHELDGANADLRSEREMRDNFVALLTHDLRTPLNVAMMNAHLAIRKVANPQDVITHASKTIDAIGRHWSCDDVLRAIDNLGSNAAKYGDTTRPITVTIRAHHDVVDRDQRGRFAHIIARSCRRGPSLRSSARSRRRSRWSLVRSRPSTGHLHGRRSGQSGSRCR